MNQIFSIRFLEIYFMLRLALQASDNMSWKSSEQQQETKYYKTIHANSLETFYPSNISENILLTSDSSVKVSKFNFHYFPLL